MKKLAFVILLLVTACTEPKPPTFSPDGIWDGDLSGATMTLTLSSTGSAIIGSSVVVSGTNSLSMSVTGTWSESAVTMTFTASGYQPMTFTSSVVLPGSLGGYINGSGYTQYPTMFTKRK